MRLTKANSYLITTTGPSSTTTNLAACVIPAESPAFEALLCQRPASPAMGTIEAEACRAGIAVGST